MSRRAEVVALISATFIVAITIIATQPRDVFWGSDSGNRFIQMQSFLRTGSVVVEHRWPIGQHFVNVGGRTYSFWAPTFSIVAAPFYATLGFVGLFVLPIAGTLLLIALLPMLIVVPGGARDLGGWCASSRRPNLQAPRFARGDMRTGSIAGTGIVLVFGTPILWYTVVFWEHTLAAAIVLAAFILAERERPLLAGILAGASTLFREEGYVAIISMVIAILVVRRVLRQAIMFMAGAILPLIPWWAINWKMFGNPLGLHAAVYSSIARGDKLSNFFPYLFEFSSVRVLRVALVLPAIALVLLSPVRMRASIRAVLFVLTSAGFVALTILLLRAQAPIRETLYLQGLFPAIPFSAAMFLSIPQLWSEQRFRITTVVVGIPLTTLMLHQSDFGVIWGPRHYLWLVPLMIVLAAESLGHFTAWHVAVAGVVLLLACSFTIQIEGIRILRSKLRFSESLLQAVREDPAKVVLTDVFWIPEDLAAGFYEKQFGLVRNDGELAAALTSVGRRPLLFIAARQFRLISNRGFATLLPRVTRRRRIVGIDPMLDVMLLDVR